MFDLTHEEIDPQALTQGLQDHRAGALVAFEGWVRNHNEGREVQSLEYEAYDRLAHDEATRILQEALDRYDIYHGACVHRVGHLQIGDVAVWVGISAPHRGDAFAACRFVIDEIKHRLPIWKKEHYTEGPSEWVNCQHCAEHAHARHHQDQ